MLPVSERGFRGFFVCTAFLLITSSNWYFVGRLNAAKFELLSASRKIKYKALKNVASK